MAGTAMTHTGGTPVPRLMAERGLQECLLARARRELGGYSAVSHHQDSVGEAEEFGHFAADHEDADAARGEVAQELVDLRLGPYVDAACRLVHDQQVAVSP